MSDEVLPGGFFQTGKDILLILRLFWIVWTRCLQRISSRYLTNGYLHQPVFLGLTLSYTSLTVKAVRVGIRKMRRKTFRKAAIVTIFFLVAFFNSPPPYITDKSPLDRYIRRLTVVIKIRLPLTHGPSSQTQRGGCKLHTVKGRRDSFAVNDVVEGAKRQTGCFFELYFRVVFSGHVTPVRLTFSSCVRASDRFEQETTLYIWSDPLFYKRKFNTIVGLTGFPPKGWSARFICGQTESAPKRTPDFKIFHAISPHPPCSSHTLLSNHSF